MRTHRLPLLIILAAGCTEDRQQLLEKTETMIGQSGGTALSADGLMTLTIPPGALTEETPITIETLRKRTTRLVSHVYELGPDGQTFAVPIRAELGVPDQSEALALANLDQAEPMIVPGSVHDRGEGVVRAPLEHFSSYGAITASSLFDPCLNLACGSACTTCDPNDPSCTPTGGTSCDANGMCMPSSNVSCEDPNLVARFVLSPASLSFSAEIGASAAGTLDVENTGDAPGTIQSITIVPAGPFSANAALPVTLAPGGSLAINVSFAPTLAGNSTATLHVETSEGTLAASLIGQAITSTPTTCTESFQQPARGALDVLLIVDSSCSMADEQAQLGMTAGVLLSALATNNLDYHIGVTTPDTDVNGERGELVTSSNGIRIVDESTVDPTTELADLVNVGFNGSGIETGFDAIELALSMTATNTPNAGFLRQDAWLTVIVMSDEDDGSSQSAVELADFLYALKAPGGEQAIRINGITGEAAGCGGAAQPAPRYLDAITRTNGVSNSICGTGWNGALSALGGQGLGFPYKYTLRGNPMPATIQVSASGGAAPFLYDPPTNTVVLTGTIPPALSDVVVTYQGDCSP